MEQESRRGVQRPVRRINPTLVALIAGLVLFLGLVAYFATRIIVRYGFGRHDV